MEFPQMIRIDQDFDAPVVEDVHEAVLSEVARLKLGRKISSGQTAAVACGSRGVTNYASIVQATIEALKKLGLEPFIVPAMGSHGSSTAEGQVDILRHRGISEVSMGAPIRSSLDVIAIGETRDRVPVFMDRHAAQADHVVLVNRIKAHTDFQGEVGSGLLKMLAVGLGKPRGAATYHQAIFSHGYSETILSFARTHLQFGKLLFGVGSIENAYGQTARIVALPPESLIEEEAALLEVAKQLAPRLPFESADVLVIDEMGKEISGTGFDTNVVGRIQQPQFSGEPISPQVKRIVVCDLTDDSYGNALGVGHADFITQCLADKIDRGALYSNAIAALQPEPAKIPLTLANDREAIEIAMRSVGRIPIESLRLIRIRNTMALGEVDVSEAYRDEVGSRTDLTIRSVAAMQFDTQGNLPAF